MSSINLSTLSIPQMVQLQKDVQQEIVRREREEKKNAVAALQQLAAERGFNLIELLGVESIKVDGRGGKRGPVAAKYRNPDRPEQVWTGRGRKPQWVSEQISQGRTLDDLLILI